MAATFLNNNVAKIGQNWPILTDFQTSFLRFSGRETHQRTNTVKK
jgi:hypothetical protein